MSEFENVTTPPPPVTTGPTAEERQWALFAHLSVLLGGLVSSAFGGWGYFIGPLVIWLIKKDTMPFVADQAKEALNFAITVSIIFVGLWILTVVVAFVTLGLGAVFVVPLMFIVGIAALVLTIMAAVSANKGESYRYPLTLRLVK